MVTPTTLLNVSLLVKLVFGLKNERPPSLKVYQGTEATEGMFPSIGSVFLMDYQRGIRRCGATLIDYEWAVSAAHCFCNRTTGKPQNFLIANFIIGDVDYIIRSEWHQEASFEYIIHEEYNYTNDQNDIALLHLEPKLRTTEYVKPQKLSTSPIEEVKYGNCQVAGWGKKSETVQTTKLLYANLSLTNNSECEDMWNNFDSSTMLCAGSLESDACMGDSGGPLYCTKENSKEPEVVGIVSFGVSICEPSITGVYVKVSAYNEWIKDKTANASVLWIILSCVIGVIIIVLIVLLVIYKRRKNETEPNIYESMHARPNPSQYTRLT
ncbi:Tissue-type plasminogen activator [Holothuria leucospilota]|uniref:Tissue-type plasminogen activator n=1 Tax=Holothuria leucospilota TaxID=206669 RepID=A0A9Q1BR78_HOLLE|nr:Tissue-type plasminogen activator [Holothuria leucospilota]